MRALTIGLSLFVLASPAWADFDVDAQAILGQGRWGLVEGTGTASDITEARKCDKTTMAFAFSANEIQRIVSVNGTPSAGPPGDMFADVKVEKGVTVTTLALFSGKGDALPATSYSFDSIGRTLTHTDAVQGETYALCNG